jgi:transcriptional regulator with XRE-family HTH domain
MNQEKIGKFIAYCRKEKNMTQEELAQRLHLTDKAISKWENGRCLPDLSILEPLSKTLDVSINEILSGEKIKEEELKDHTDKNIIDVVNYSDEKIKRIKRAIKVSSIIMIIALATLMFASDYDHIKEGKKPDFMFLVSKKDNKYTYLGLGSKLVREVAVEETDPLYYDKKVEFGLWLITWKVNIKDLKPEDVWIIDGHNRVKANLVSYELDPDIKQAITNGTSRKFNKRNYPEVLLSKAKDVLALTSSKYKIKEINIYDIENNKKICSNIEFEDYSFEVPNLKGKYVFELVTSNARGIYNYSFAIEIQ